MANFPTPSQIQTQYFQILQSINPSINTNDPNSDFVIRGNVFAGFASGLYGDQAKTDNDTFISSASPAALTLHGADLDIPQNQATAASSTDLRIFGNNGTVITPGQITALYLPTGITYTNTTGGTVSGGQLDIAIQANSPGSIGNVSASLSPTLQIVSPPTGITSTATLITDISDGTDIESTDSYRARLLNRLQQPPSGGNANDYYEWAFDASPSVTTAVVQRFGRGLGTVDIYILTGTTNIDFAVTNGLSIVRIPDATLIDTVQAFYNTDAPLTDCPEVYAPTEIDVNVTLNYELAPGITLATVPNDPVNNPLGLTVAQLIVREMGRPLYHVPVGGWPRTGFSAGYVIAAYIEESLDDWLSSNIDPTTGTTGAIPILSDRQIQPLNGSEYDLPLLGNQITAPGTMTYINGVP